MARRSCIVIGLALMLLAGQSPGQQWVSSSFGAAAEATFPSNSGAPSLLESLPGRIASTLSHDEPPALAQPAIHETPDRYAPSVQQISHTVRSDSIPSEEGSASPFKESESSMESSGAAQSAAKSGRDSGFPSLAPSGRRPSGGTPEDPPARGLGAVLTVISSLAVVLGLFFITAWLLRRTGAGGLATLPSDVFELLGRAPLTGRQQVHLLRCGTKLLLVSVTPDSAETLTEIDDPDEATRLAGLCKASQAGSATAAFRQVLHQFARQPAEPGFMGRDGTADSRAHLPSGQEHFHG